MKLARIAVLGLAAGAALAAALVAKGMVSKDPVPQQAEKPKIETVRVLVATQDIGLGATVTASSIGWQDWPQAAVTSRYITEASKPKAIKELGGAAARAPILSGEPIVRQKLVHREDGGVMSAILESGMRAISVKTSPETGAGGFILPNDRVDVILTRRVREGGSNKEVHRSETILANVRVLAIDQAIEQKENGQAVAVGKTATLELKPDQAEVLALAESMGDISLALRSLADIASREGMTGPEMGSASLGGRRAGTVTVLRYGVQSSVDMAR